MADTIRSGATEQKITHHVKFSNGGTELGLVLCDGRGNATTQGFRQGKMPNRSLQISQGDPDYSDMELPYTPITQKDWSGGRGNKYFELDKTRYADGQNTDASKGEIILGPKATSVVLENITPITNAQEDSQNIANPFTAGFWSSTVTYFEETCTISLPYQVVPIYSVNYQVRATRFQYTSSSQLSKIKLWLAGTNKVTIAIRKSDSVDISTDQKKKDLSDYLMKLESLGSNEKSETFNIVNSSEIAEYEFDFALDLVENDYYWLVVRSEKLISGPFTDFPFIVGTNNTPSTYEYQGLYGTPGGFDIAYDTTEETVSDAAAFYTATGDSLAYVLTPLADKPGSAHFFTLRNTKFMVTSPSDGSAPKLFMEGYHGYAWDDNNGALEKLFSKNIGSEAVGAIAKIVGGPGSTELVRWREIQSVTTGASGYVTVDPAWNIEHTTSTEFAIFGTGQWTEITGHGLTAAVTDVIVVNDIVYFAMGESTKVKRTTCENAAGVWQLITPFVEEDLYASYLALIQNEEGDQKIWRALATASTVSSSDVKTWGNALAFGDAITCGNTMYRINGLVAYGTPRIPYVLKQDGFGAISNDIYDQVPLAEFAAVADDNNGKANLQRGVYLYLSMLNGLERYYEGRLDDIGPNRDEGLPNNRNGRISSMLAYPGRMYASIDHPTGYSSVMLYNDLGWHEIYRSSLGARIYAIDVQVIDGDKCDRIWIAQEGSITYFPVAIDPRKQSDYTYSSTGSIETSWINGNFAEIVKYYSSVEIFSENLAASAQYVRISYKVDSDDNDWTEIDENIDTSPSQKVDFPNHNVYGKRIKLKMTLYTADNLKTPRIMGITINPVTRLPIKKSWSLTFRVDDNFFDLQGRRSELNASELMAQIESWADSDTTPTPLLMNVPHALFDNKYVFIEPESLRPIQWLKDDSVNGKKLNVGIGQLTVYEA